MLRLISVILFMLMLGCSPNELSKFEKSTKTDFIKLMRTKKTADDLVELKQIELYAYRKNNDVKRLINAKYIDFWMKEQNFTNNTSVESKLEVLFKVKAMSEFVYPEMEAECLFHLGLFIRYSNYSDLAIYYWKKAVKICEEINYNGPIAEIYRAEGVLAFENNNYLKAFDNFLKASNYYIQKKDFLYTASMHNNMAIVNLKMGKLNNALNNIKSALFFFNKINNPSTYDFFIRYLIDYTKSEIHIKQKKFSLAIESILPLYYFLHKQLLNKSDNPEYYRHFISKSLKLLELRQFIEDKSFSVEIIQNLEEINKLNLTTENHYLINDALIEIYQKYGDNRKLLDVLNLQNKVSKQFLREEQDWNSIVSNVTQKNRIKSENSRYNLLLEKKQTESKLKLYILLFVMGIIFLILLVLVNKYRFQKEILNKNKEIFELEKQQLEQDNKLKEERLAKLNLSINLKNESERIFLEKIKEIRRSNKDKISEDVLKDVQFKMKNLLEIDTKNTDISVKSDEVKRQFFDKLILKHPNLTNKDLELCSHIRLGLTSKEIATIEDVVSGTIRVYKTKLKAKLGIPKEQTIEAYLKELMG